ncbi:hypothetical protein OG693_39570 (plasmid) [Streptomyces sp. NBC_01259]|uniref:hypothetical protein n=1 Tax=Streptomyces sp. NBC_01259 TaxID=2903800 RepID=UPI002F90706B
MAKLSKAVHVRDPERHRTVLLLPGEEPAPHLAALVTNPDCWEDGQLPDAPAKDAESKSEETASATGDDSEDTKPAARKTAAKKPARGRTAAAEGTGGQ